MEDASLSNLEAINFTHTIAGSMHCQDKKNSSSFGKFTYRLSGLAKIPLASLVDFVAHGILSASKFIAGIVVLPYQFYAVIFKRSMISEWTLSSSLVHFTICLETAIKTIPLTLLMIADPARSDAFSERSLRKQKERFEAEKCRLEALIRTQEINNEENSNRIIEIEEELQEINRQTRNVEQDAATLRTQCTQLTRERDLLQRENQRLQRQNTNIETIQSERDESARENEELSGEVRRLRTHNDQLRTSNNAMNRQITELRQRNQECSQTYLNTLKTYVPILREVHNDATLNNQTARQVGRLWDNVTDRIAVLEGRQERVHPDAELSLPSS